MRRAEPGKELCCSQHGPTPESSVGPAHLPEEAGRRFRNDRALQGLGLGKSGKSLRETGIGWIKPRVPEPGELLAWERAYKGIRTEFHSRKCL